MRPILMLACLLASLATAAREMPDEELLVGFLQEWDHATYQLQGDDRIRAYRDLVTRLRRRNAAMPDVPELLIVEGITLSAWAEIAPRLKALKLIRRARAVLERSLELDPTAMEGSAYGTLGALYAKAPGWPLSFGDDEKAEDYFHKALRQNPQSIDVNYYYAEYLAGQGENDRAIASLRRALAAPEHDWRPVGEAGRRAQINALLATLQE